MKGIIRISCIIFFTIFQLQAADEFLPKVKRILFLGDSITYDGKYVGYFNAYLISNFPDRNFEVINVGLASETVSGLSEPNHAGGKFPRPDLHERLDRVLTKIKPDLVFACYGMNDGIYLPLAEDRFDAFKNGMKKLRQKVEANNAKIIHITPPNFDLGPKAAAGTPDYNDVLGAYSKWLLEQKKDGWNVIDLHGPMTKELADQRAQNPSFVFASDRVHPNAAGHWIFTREILRGLNQNTDDISTDPRYSNLIKLSYDHMQILRDAWLTETGHNRPGVRKGLPIAEAQTKAATLETEMKQTAPKLK